MSESIEAGFTVEAQQFLSNALGMLAQPVFDVSVNVTKQTLGASSSSTRGYRSLQALAPLNVELFVQGLFKPVAGMAEIPEDIDLGTVCTQIFRVQGTSVFLPELQTVDAAYFQSVTLVDAKEVSDDGTDDAPSSGGDDGLSTGVIVGIAAGGAFVVIAGGLFLYNRQKGRNVPGDASTWGSNPPPTSPRQPSAVMGSERKSRGFFSGANRSSDEVSRRLNEEEEVPPPVSPRVQRADSEDMSYLQSDRQSDMGGMDTMSFTYSLDHGFDQQSEIQSEISSAVGPNIMGTNKSSEEEGDDMELAFELGAVPQPLKDGLLTRECFAPPGKLGITIDTTARGPIVHTVNPGSPLEGILWPGDMLVAIDDEDCRTLSAAAITERMASTADRKRKLTIVSDTTK